MARLEDLGRELDEAVERMRKYVETEVMPSAKRGTVEALRLASSKLTELANNLESRRESAPESKNAAGKSA